MTAIVAFCATTTPATATPATEAPAETFRSFTSKTGKYKVKFPARAELSEESSELMDGVKMYSLFGLVPSPRTVYGVMYFDFPKKPANPAQSVKEIGEGTRGKSKLLNTEELDLGEDLTAREWQVKTPNSYFRYRVILKERRGYHVALMSEDEDVITSDDAEKFFNSFQITD